MSISKDIPEQAKVIAVRDLKDLDQYKWEKECWGKKWRSDDYLSWVCNVSLLFVTNYYYEMCEYTDFCSIHFQDHKFFLGNENDPEIHFYQNINMNYEYYLKIISIPVRKWRGYRWLALAVGVY